MPMPNRCSSGEVGSQIRPFLGKTVVQRRQTPLGPSTCDVCIGSHGRAHQKAGIARDEIVLWPRKSKSVPNRDKEEWVPTPKFPRFADVICEWPLYGQKPLHRQNSVERSGWSRTILWRPTTGQRATKLYLLPPSDDCIPSGRFYRVLFGHFT